MRGFIDAIFGSVVDVRFTPGSSPRLREALHVTDAAERALEVQSQVEPGLVRSIDL